MMFAYPLRTAALAIGAAIGLSACTTGYGYNGVSVGVSSGGYYDPYYSDYGYGYGAGYPGYGYGYGYGASPYYGWYDGLYYPGTGYYVYDRHRRAHRWSDRHRRHWEGRRERSLTEGFRNIATNWSGFDNNQAAGARQVRQSATSPVQVERRGDRPSRIERSGARSERGAIRRDRQSAQSERRSVRTERQSARAEQRSQAREGRESRSNGRSRDNNREQ